MPRDIIRSPCGRFGGVLGLGVGLQVCGVMSTGSPSHGADAGGSTVWWSPSLHGRVSCAGARKATPMRTATLTTDSARLREAPVPVRSSPPPALITIRLGLLDALEEV